MQIGTCKLTIVWNGITIFVVEIHAVHEFSISAEYQILINFDYIKQSEKQHGEYSRWIACDYVSKFACDGANVTLQCLDLENECVCACMHACAYVLARMCVHACIFLTCPIGGCGRCQYEHTHRQFGVCVCVCAHRCVCVRGDACIFPYMSNCSCECALLPIRTVAHAHTPEHTHRRFGVCVRLRMHTCECVRARMCVCRRNAFLHVQLQL